MAAAGINNVLQLDGGILRYFERAPGAQRWRGNCLVFDGRTGLDASLAEAAAPACCCCMSGLLLRAFGLLLMDFEPTLREGHRRALVRRRSAGLN